MVRIPQLFNSIHWEISVCERLQGGFGRRWRGPHHAPATGNRTPARRRTCWRRLRSPARPRRVCRAARAGSPASEACATLEGAEARRWVWPESDSRSRRRHRVAPPVLRTCGGAAKRYWSFSLAVAPLKWRYVKCSVTALTLAKLYGCDFSLFFSLSLFHTKSLWHGT